MKENVPEFRFEGFTDTWEQRKLGDLIIKGGSGGTPKSTIKKYYGGNIPFLSITDLTNSNGYIEKTEKTITEEGLDNSAAWIVPQGSISLAMYASVGKVAILNIDTATSQAFYNLIFEEETIRDFTYQRLVYANETNEWGKLVSTGTQSNLNAQKVKSFEVRLPQNKGELSYISNLHKLIDHLITLQQRELDYLKETKKTILSELFPKKSETIPGVRFDGFTDAWEQRKLGDMVKITMGQSPSSKNYTDDPNDNILVQGNADIKDGRVVPRVWTKQITKSADRNDLILSVRAPVGEVAMTDFPVVLGRGVAGIKGEEFIYHLLIKMQQDNYWGKLSTGSTFESINSSDIVNAEAWSTNPNEEKYIGTFFSTFDHLITLQQRKLDLLKSQKQTLLKSMFPR